MVASYNGWAASTDPAAIDIDRNFTAAGRKFPGGVKRGPVSVVFKHLVEQFDKRVEDVDLHDPGDEWGYVFKQSANSPSLVSCHASGTAIDINATRHPNGKRGTFTPKQVATIRQILDELDGVVRWGGDFGTPDEMHFEVKGTPTDVARVAGKLLATSEAAEPKRTLPTQSRGGAMYHPTDPNRADDFWVAADGSVRHAFYTGGKWTGEENLGGVVVSNFAAAWRGDGRQLRIVGVGTDGKRWERVYETATGKWSAWRHVGGQ